MTEYLEFSNLTVDLKTVFKEIIEVVTHDKKFEVVTERYGEDEDGNPFMSLHARMTGKSQRKIQNIEVERLARGLLGITREVLVTVRGTAANFSVEIAAGKMTENFVTSALTGVIIAGPLGLALPGASVVFARKYENDLLNRIGQAIETLNRTV